VGDGNWNGPVRDGVKRGKRDVPSNGKGQGVKKEDFEDKSRAIREGGKGEGLRGGCTRG